MSNLTLLFDFNNSLQKIKKMVKNENKFWLSIFQNNFSSEDISTLSNLPKTHSSADSGNLIYHTNTSKFALSNMAIATATSFQLLHTYMYTLFLCK